MVKVGLNKIKLIQKLLNFGTKTLNIKSQKCRKCLKNNKLRPKNTHNSIKQELTEPNRTKTYFFVQFKSFFFKVDLFFNIKPKSFYHKNILKHLMNYKNFSY